MSKKSFDPQMSRSGVIDQATDRALTSAGVWR